MVRTSLLVAGIALASVLAACGGPSKEDYVAQVDAICKTRNRLLDSAGFTPSTVSSFSGTGPAEDAAKAVENTSSRIKAVKPPEEIKSQAELYSGQLDRLPSAIDDVAASAKSGDRRAHRAAVADLRGVTRESERLARDAGLKTCAEPTPTLSR